MQTSLFDDDLAPAFVLPPAPTPRPRPALVTVDGWLKNLPPSQKATITDVPTLNVVSQDGCFYTPARFTLDPAVTLQTGPGDMRRLIAPDGTVMTLFGAVDAGLAWRMK